MVYPFLRLKMDVVIVSVGGYQFLGSMNSTAFYLIELYGLLNLFVAVLMIVW